jgi:hypothetical protein
MSDFQCKGRGDPTCSHYATLTAERDALRGERDGLREAENRARRHPLAPERCPSCEWTNTHLMNFGEPGRSNWMCHGCAARAIADRDRVRALALEACDLASHFADVAGHPDDEVAIAGTTRLRTLRAELGEKP